MRIQPTTRRTFVALGAAFALAGAFLAADLAAAAPPAKDAKLAAMIPAALRAKGSITAATEPDNETLVGLDIDLGKALGQVLGIKITFVPAKFDAIIPGLEARRYDISIDAMADTPARRKQVDFIDYFQSGSALFVPAAGTAPIASLDDLCGYKVGVVKGTFQVEDAEAQAAKCKSAGGKTLEVDVFPDQSAMIHAISSGRVDAIMMDSAVGNHLAKEAKGKFKQTGGLTKAKRKGIAVPKGETALREALQGALQKLIDDGTYAAILESYNQGAGAIPKATINDGDTSS